ncbi:hypothetical protein CCHR01_15229 [Colletotrichum chrysophilum]|uniref:Uncharacterized protein n=1 Tax=Colletotrichum chrysophilum TaxID=1836956 RepID=A0AAD9A6Q5_9PEZI|nr:hypothetical protein CCHR01_15229 [Colletotrichum chrysophilum]
MCAWVWAAHLSGSSSTASDAPNYVRTAYFCGSSDAAKITASKDDASESPLIELPAILKPRASSCLHSVLGHIRCAIPQSILRRHPGAGHVAAERQRTPRSNPIETEKRAHPQARCTDSLIGVDQSTEIVSDATSNTQAVLTHRHRRPGLRSLVHLWNTRASLAGPRRSDCPTRKGPFARCNGRAGATGIRDGVKMRHHQCTSPISEHHRVRLQRTTFWMHASQFPLKQVLIQPRVNRSYQMSEQQQTSVLCQAVPNGESGCTSTVAFRGGADESSSVPLPSPAHRCCCASEPLLQVSQPRSSLLSLFLGQTYPHFAPAPTSHMEHHDRRIHFPSDALHRNVCKRLKARKYCRFLNRQPFPGPRSWLRQANVRTTGLGSSKSSAKHVAL